MLNVGVIGCGGMGKDHIKRLTEKFREHRLQQYLMYLKRSKEAAKIAGGAKVYTDGKDLINDPDVDAVFIVS